MRIYRHDPGKVILILLAIAVIIAILFPPQVRAQEFRMSEDSFFTHDKLEHLTAGCVLYMGILRITENNDLATFATIGLGILWEVKDAYVPWEKYGWWGGDGFSWKDICYDILGIVCAQVILEVFEAPVFIQARYGNGSGRLNLTVAF